jgi:membrane protein YdbS with pleckstrin-like domain
MQLFCFFSSAILFYLTILTLFRCSMVSSTHFSLNQPFKPAQALVTWLSVNFILFFLLVMSFTAFPVLLVSGSEPAVLFILGFIILVPVVVFFVWVGLYYKSMWYELREDEMSWKRGVWFRTTGVVPYNRITNLDVRQGPVMRLLGISTLSVQTAGYSGQAVPEIRIEGIEQAEELRELIRSLERQPGTTGDGTGGAPARVQLVPLTTDQKILDELVRIRQLLEMQRK